MLRKLCALAMTARASVAVALMLLAASTTAEIAPGRAVSAFTWALAERHPDIERRVEIDIRGILAMP